MIKSNQIGVSKTPNRKTLTNLHRTSQIQYSGWVWIQSVFGTILWRSPPLRRYSPVSAYKEVEVCAGQSCASRREQCACPSLYERGLLSEAKQLGPYLERVASPPSATACSVSYRAHQALCRLPTLEQCLVKKKTSGV